MTRDRPAGKYFILIYIGNYLQKYRVRLRSTVDNKYASPGPLSPLRTLRLGENATLRRPSARFRGTCPNGEELLPQLSAKVRILEILGRFFFFPAYKLSQSVFLGQRLQSRPKFRIYSTSSTPVPCWYVSLVLPHVALLFFTTPFRDGHVLTRPTHKNSTSPISTSRATLVRYRD